MVPISTRDMHMIRQDKLKKPPRRRRLETGILHLRQDLAHVAEYSEGQSRSKILKSTREIFATYKLHSTYKEETAIIFEFFDILN